MTPAEQSDIAAPRPRRTLREPVKVEGRGIHGNLPAALQIGPASAGFGLRAIMDGSKAEPLPLTLENADADLSVRRTVMVGPDGERFEQLEHVMAALAAAGVTDALLVQSGPEPPFLGGGSLEYCDALDSVGYYDHPGETVEPILIDRPLHLRDGEAELVATPHEGFRLTCYVEFPGTIVGSAGVSMEVTRENFRREAAPARTFALEADIEALRRGGLAQGGTLENAVVFNAEGYLNNRLFFEDEVVRHKLIDLLGDLALLGRPLAGHFWAWRAGHQSHVRFARLIREELLS
jgi:UDP-3-O-[3-hydroxymyristoyl] N-acetylglucosamine deacetylase